MKDGWKRAGGEDKGQTKGKGQIKEKGQIKGNAINLWELSSS